MFVTPEKKIANVLQVVKFYRSKAFKDYTDMLRRISDAIVGITTGSPTIVANPNVIAVMDMIAEVEGWIREIPLEDMEKQRFGNKAFRKWHTKLTEMAPQLVERLLPEDKKEAKIELVPYLLDSFGNATRIDYGSGHEAAFLMFIYCLYSLEVLKEGEDDVAVALRLFQRYLVCVRQLQKTYRMEPAGSRGVNALDDFQFIPFYWGSAQLIGNEEKLIPDHYINPTIVERHASRDLFFEAIQYINETKIGAFYEHSNQLFNISAVERWEKVNSGLFKMYEAEVLKKFPVIQHFLFGSLLSIDLRPEFVEPRPVEEAAESPEKDRPVEEAAEPTEIQA
uniref:Serine/threonine-protein phosphatase 2A activator n=1 Tax=Steinernema glaseri TaxID=37863 RepID=A0A1I7Y161_9BILA